MDIYAIPSLAAWRAAELNVLRTLSYPRPILEIGCGSGLFSSLLLNRVDCGIDLNPRHVAICRANRTHDDVSVMDARRLDFADQSFSTVFANCVIEHIPGLDRALSEFRRILRPGGRMITTVPTSGIDRCLLFQNSRYARLRAQQLEHVNLLSKAGWQQAFRTAGFTEVRMTPYLPASFCRAWDRVDGPLSAAVGPCRTSRLYRWAKMGLPRRLRSRVDAAWSDYFLPELRKSAEVDPVAFMIEAA